MAVCRLGPIVQTIVGTVGSVTFKGGAASGVVTRRQRPPHGNSAGQEHTRKQLAYYSQAWNLMTDVIRAQWDLCATADLFNNRVGVRKARSGRTAFISFWLNLDMDIELSQLLLYAPTAGKNVEPVIESVSFESDSTSLISVSNFTELYVNEYLRIQRHLEYGRRVSGGMRLPTMNLLRDSSQLNWLPALQEAGVVLDSGEQIGLSICWFMGHHAVSTRASTETTVI